MKRLLRNWLDRKRLARSSGACAGKKPPALGPRRKSPDGNTLMRVTNSIPRRAALATVAVILALPAMPASAPPMPTSDFEYDPPCDSNGSGPSYGGEAGARVGVIGIGGSACATNPKPCTGGVGGAVGNAYGHCSYVPTCYRVCIYVEVLGHLVQYCWENCE